MGEPLDHDAVVLVEDLGEDGVVADLADHLDHESSGCRIRGLPDEFGDHVEEGLQGIVGVAMTLHEGPGLG
ncbi:hypothetical protein NJ76_08720 [Rhodococcus sp. IITR03]|nr:hypothetical protein NJ76_08720 [Rhodococcus sp. IITR03]